MKKLIQILLLVLLVGCATPHNPVLITGEGGYYNAPRSTLGPYYGTRSMMFSDIVVYPWWVGGYRPRTFAYYSPNFYPHYFSVWYPPGYHPYYGFYGGYNAYWCPPYRIRRNRSGRGDERFAGSPVLPPMAQSGQQLADPGLWRSMDRMAINRKIINQGRKGNIATLPARPASVYSGSPAASAWSTMQMGSTRSAGFSRGSARSVTSSRSKSMSPRSSTLHKQ